MIEQLNQMWRLSAQEAKQGLLSLWGFWMCLILLSSVKIVTILSINMLLFPQLSQILAANELHVRQTHLIQQGLLWRISVIGWLWMSDKSKISWMKKKLVILFYFKIDVWLKSKQQKICTLLKEMRNTVQFVSLKCNKSVRYRLSLLF